MHKVVPVAGIADLEKTRDDLIIQTEVRPSGIALLEVQR